MDCFQTSHEQGKHNADQRDKAHQLPSLELTSSGLHGRLRWMDTARVQVSAYSNFHSLANVFLIVSMQDVPSQALTKVYRLVGVAAQECPLQTLGRREIA
jgi:hypothetical protein